MPLQPPPHDSTTDLCKYRVTTLAAPPHPLHTYGGEHEEALAAAAALDAVAAAAATGDGGGGGIDGSQCAPESAAPATGVDVVGSSRVVSWGPHRLYWAPVLLNSRITAEGHFQDVRHIVMDVAGLSQVHAPGDVLCVMPSQPASAVQAFCARCGLNPDAWVRIEPVDDGRQGGGVGAMAEVRQNGGAGPAAVVRVGALVAGALDINGASPRRFFFEVLRRFACSEVEAERLDYFCSAEGRDDLWNYNQREGRAGLYGLERGIDGVKGWVCERPLELQSNHSNLYGGVAWGLRSMLVLFRVLKRQSVLDGNQLVHAGILPGRTALEALQDFKSATPPLEWLLECIPRLMPRQFSIASSARLHPGRVHIIVAVVDWVTPYKRRRRGVCSSWLAGEIEQSKSKCGGLPCGITCGPTWLHACNITCGPTWLHACKEDGAVSNHTHIQRLLLVHAACRS